MLINVIVIFLIGVFIFYCIVDSARKYIGYNPNPKPWREQWKTFVKKHIVDEYPYDDESHSKTRYR
jgi:hypothetical protein